jgi:hypothetical protein
MICHPHTYTDESSASLDVTPPPTRTGVPSQPTFQVDVCVSLNELLTRTQVRVVDGAVVALLDACRTEAGLAVTSVVGLEGSRYPTDGDC